MTSAHFRFFCTSWLLFVNLTQTYTHVRRGHLIWKKKWLYKIGLWVNKKGILLIDSCCRRIPATVVNATLGQMVLRYKRKLDEQALESKPVSSTPPRSLLQFLLRDYCLEFLPWLLSVMECYMEIQAETKIFPPCCFWSECFISSTQPKQAHTCMQCVPWENILKIISLKSW